MFKVLKKMLPAAIVCCLLVAFGAFSALAASSIGYNGLYYNPDNGLIVGYIGSNSNLVIPSQINGITIVGIQGGCLSPAKNITSVTFPDTFTTINPDAFYGDINLTKVTIPSSITSIGADAFSHCGDGLTIYAPDGSYAQTYATANHITFVDTTPPASSSETSSTASSATSSQDTASSSSSGSASSGAGTVSSSSDVSNSPSEAAAAISSTPSGSSRGISSSDTSSTLSDMSGNASQTQTEKLMALKTNNPAKSNSSSPQTLIIIIGVAAILVGALTSFLIIKFKIFSKKQI